MARPVLGKTCSNALDALEAHWVILFDTYRVGFAQAGGGFGGLLLVCQRSAEVSEDHRRSARRAGVLRGFRQGISGVLHAPKQDVTNSAESIQTFVHEERMIINGRA